MARALIPGDFVGKLVHGFVVTTDPGDSVIWDSETGGVQLTDLLVGGQPATVVPIESDGYRVPFELPDGVSGAWEQVPGAKRRYRVQAGPPGPAGPGGSDAEVALYVDDPESATNASLSATYGPGGTEGNLGKVEADDTYAAKGVGATQGLIAKINADLVDPVMLVVGDSTAASPGRWVQDLAEILGARFPTHTVKLHQFNTTGTLAYDAPATISTGTGAQTLNIYNAAIGGHYTGSWRGAKGAAAFDGLNPDLTLIALGHNEGSAAVSDRWHGQYLALTEDLTARSDTALICIAQNPKMLSAGVSAEEQEARREVYRAIASRRGYGFVDVCQAFLDTGQAFELTSDGTHPTTAGYQLWADVVAEAFVRDKGREPRPQGPSSFTLAGPVLNRNPVFESGLAYWLLSGATAVTDATHTETAAVKVTNDGAGAGYLYQDLPADRVKGRWVTVAARVYIPAGTVDSAGVLALDDSTGATQTTGHSHGKDGFRWDVVTRFFPAAVVNPRVKLYASVVASTDAIWVDRIIVTEGRLPRDVARPDPGGEWKAYTPALSANITLGSGTVVAAYRQDPLSKTVEGYAKITLAADSTVNGSTVTTIGLPVNLLSGATTIAKEVTILDASAGAAGRFMGMALALNVDKLSIYSLGASSAATGITGTAPFTWATGDSIEVNFRYRYA